MKGMNKKINQLFGFSETVQSKDSDFREELVFWNSQACDELGYIEKSNFGEETLKLFQTYFKPSSLETKLTVVFDEKLKKTFHFYGKENFPVILEELGVVLVKVKNSINSIDVFIGNERMNITMTLAPHVKFREIEISGERFLNALKQKMKQNFFNSAKINIKELSTQIEMTIAFENKEIEIAPSLRGKSSENINEI